MSVLCLLGKEIPAIRFLNVIDEKSLDLKTLVRFIKPIRDILGGLQEHLTVKAFFKNQRLKLYSLVFS